MENKGTVIALIITAILGIAIWITMSHFEQKAFNKFSTQQSTLSDAMFLQLRVIVQVNNKGD